MRASRPSPGAPPPKFVPLRVALSTLPFSPDPRPFYVQIPRILTGSPGGRYSRRIFGDSIDPFLGLDCVWLRMGRGLLGHDLIRPPHWVGHVQPTNAPNQRFGGWVAKFT